MPHTCDFAGQCLQRSEVLHILVPGGLLFAALLAGAEWVNRTAEVKLRPGLSQAPPKSGPRAGMRWPIRMGRPSRILSRPMSSLPHWKSPARPQPGQGGNLRIC